MSKKTRPQKKKAGRKKSADTVCDMSYYEMPFYEEVDPRDAKGGLFGRSIETGKYYRQIKYIDRK